MLNDLIARREVEHAGLTLAPGRRVIDNLTSEGGVILKGAVYHERTAAPNKAVGEGAAVPFAVPQAVTVERYQVALDDGSTVTRERRELVVLPETLQVDLEEFEV